MRCNDHRAKFTERYDGELSEESLRDLEQHCASCAACGTEWNNYLKSVEDLQVSGIASIPDDYVDEILAATLGAQAEQFPDHVIPTPVTRPTDRRLHWSHAASALIGAALVLIFTQVAPQFGYGTEQTETALVDPTHELAHAAENGTVVPEPARPLDQGSSADAQELEPVIQTKIQYVNRAIFVPIPMSVPVEVSKPVIRRSAAIPLGKVLARASDSFLRMSAALEENTRQSIALANQRSAEENALEPNSTYDEPDLDPVLIASYKPQRSSERVPATLAIKRMQDRVSLSTMGSLDEVVPALIQRIDDQDPAVGELVELRLQEIWSERTGEEFLESPLAFEREALDLRDVGWRRFVQAKDSDDVTPSMTEQWTTWWAAEQISLASAAF